MTSTQLQQQIDPLEHRKSELQERQAKLAGEITAHTNARARALASGELAEPLVPSARLQTSREELDAVTLAIAQLEAELARLVVQLHRAIQGEEQASAAAEFRAAREAAVAAIDGRRREISEFLHRYAQRSKAVRETQERGRAALRRHNIAQGVPLERADSGWTVDLADSAGEANLCNTLEYALRDNRITAAGT